MTTAVKTRPKARAVERSTRDGVGVAYETDPYSWGLQQARLLRLEDHVRSDLSRITQHLLKWDLQPERRSRSWSLSIRDHRRRVDRRLRRGPGLKTRLPDLVAEAYESGRDHAMDETGLPEHAVPPACTYSWDDIMSRSIEGPEPP